MKKLLVSVAALALLAAPAFAQENGHPPRAMSAQHPDRNPNHGNMGGMRGPQPAQQQAPRPAPQPQAAPQAQPRPGAEGMRGGNRGGEYRGQSRPQQVAPNAPAMQRGDYRGNDRRGGNDRFDTNRGPRGGDYRRNDRPRVTDFRNYRRNFTAPRRFRAPAYIRPQGWYAHRWSYGEILPPAFFVRNYWIDDFYDYGLIDPPYGTVWVRYGADALLVDEYSGEVIQVAYGVFY